VSPEVEPVKIGGLRIALRFVLVLNFALFALSFVPKFEGTASALGLADKLFMPAAGGFRYDFLWLIVSTALIGIAFVFLVTDRDRRSETVTDAAFSLLWVLAFVIFVARALLTGVLDFG